MATTDDFEQTNSTLGTLAIGGSVTGNIELTGDKDWFKISLEKGVVYVFDLSGIATGGGSLGSNGHGRLSIYDSNGLPIDSIFNGGTGGEPKLTYTPNLTASYFLEAADLSTGVGSYTLKSTAPVTPPTTGGTDTGTDITLPADGKDDFAGTASTTGRLAVAGQVTGSIETLGDKDWFKVSLEAGTNYVFDLMGLGGGGGTLGTTGSHGRLSIVAADGSYLESVFNGGAGSDPKLLFTPTASGTYYLEAADISNTGTGTYTLKWTSPATVTPPPGGGGQTADPNLTGTDAADVLNGGSGDDVIDGKGGIDTAEYSLVRSSYTVTLGSSNPTVQANLGIEGLDTLLNIERLQFSDRKVAIDITGNALHTLQFIGTVAPTYLTDLHVRGMILNLFDQNNSPAQLGQLALENGLLPVDAMELGARVYRNLFNDDPSPDLALELTNYINYHGAAKFIADVMDRGFNVDLVGLQTNGMNYI